MVRSRPFFFGNRDGIHKLYKEFFGLDDQSTTESPEGLDGDAEVDTKGSTARFYFALTYQLAKEDVGKFEQVENTNLYLCLNACSLTKERIDKQNEELKKMERKTQMR